MSDPKPDPMAGLQSLLPGLAWTSAMIEETQRAQAALAAETLKKINAPVVDALNRHREIARNLADMAKQMAMMASHVEDMARRQESITAQLQAAMEPYLRYVDWLERQGRGRKP
jgi:hypothetical protein